MGQRNDFQTKKFLADIIINALDNLDIDPDNAVVVTGKYGEKAAVFFPQDDPDNIGSPVGFFLASRNEPGKHLNMDRDQACALVALLVGAFGIKVNIEQVVHYEVVVS